MRHRTLDEMIAYFNRQVSDMDIKREYKIQLLGMITAIGYEASAQLERKKGKWIDMGDFEQCSVCLGTRLKEVQTFYGKAIWIKTDYCPNCGSYNGGET